MFRKLVAVSVASLGLLCPLAMPGQAVAHDFRHERHHEGHHEHAYRVYYRNPCRPGWLCKGTFGALREAQRVALELRCHGLQVWIR